MNTSGTADLWREFAPDLRRYLRRQVRDDALADDLLQDVFVRVHLHLARLRAPERVAPWLYRIARNLVIDHARRQAVRATLVAEPEVRDDGPEPSPEAQLAASGRRVVSIRSTGLSCRCNKPDVSPGHRMRAQKARDPRVRRVSARLSAPEQRYGAAAALLEGAVRGEGVQVDVKAEVAAESLCSGRSAKASQAPAPRRRRIMLANPMAPAAAMHNLDSLIVS